MVKSNTLQLNGMSFLEITIKISKSKNLTRLKKINISVNAIEESHFFHLEVISKEMGNEALDIILQPKCQLSERKIFSIKTESDINRESLEDVEFGSEAEQENERSFREVVNAITVEDELIPDYGIPVSAIRLNNSAQKESNIESSETEIAKENQLFSVNGENDESQIEIRMEKKIWLK
ncbi:hypothetical protein AVEN_104918-1 [Araneus ventricosus]|uniref:Uncharacterized protein n=1 Tax=Araneus ventricosus TaxID=182803 RepID=A0A4Y2RR62_ARAVE|nr:hypothetical protein AVEN_104918-1 [Araneus ventricosus]